MARKKKKKDQEGTYQGMIGAWTGFIIVCVIFIGFFWPSWWIVFPIVGVGSGAIQQTFSYLRRIKNCPYCGYKLGDAVDFCPECGKSLIIICPNCGTHAKGTGKFCEKCGSPLNVPELNPSSVSNVTFDSTPSREIPEIKPSSEEYSIEPPKYCPGCGATIKKMSKTCPKCGFEL